MTSVVFQLIEEVTAYARRDSLEDAREICADGTYFLNNLCIYPLLPQQHESRNNHLGKVKKKSTKIILTP